MRRPGQDLQALAAACGGDRWKTAADPRTGELRETWDARLDGDVECYPGLGGLFVFGGQLVELQGRGCTAHRAEVARLREMGGEVTDFEYCLSDCPGLEVSVHPIHGGQALKSYFERQYAGVFIWSGELRSDPRTGQRARYAGRRLQIAEFSDENFKDVMQANDWRVPVLAGLAYLPAIRRDRVTPVPVSGYDAVDGIWYSPADAPGQRSMAAGPGRRGVSGAATRLALDSGLVAKMLEFATQRVVWEGTFTDLGKEIGWSGSPKALSAAVWKAELQLLGFGVIVQRIDRYGPTRAAGIRVCLAPAADTRRAPEIKRSERSTLRDDLPRAILPGEIEPER